MKATTRLTEALLREEDYKNLPVGTKVHYKGDAANHSANGTITKVHYPGAYEIKMDDGTVRPGVMASNFGSGYGGHRYEVGHKTGTW